MIAELKASTDVVAAALDKHLGAWATFQKQYESNTAVLNPISDDLVHLWELTRSLDTKLKEIQAAVGRAMNLTPAIVPISRLPSDIISQIFQMTICTKTCGQLEDKYTANTPKARLIYPDTLLTVCSHWRQIALNSCTIWSHIDLFQGSLLHKFWVKRAHTFADRARRPSLELHILDGEEDTQASRALVNEFCVAVAPRVKSLDYTYPRGYGDLSLTPFYSILANCVPGSLTRLVLSSNNISESERFFEATGDPKHAKNQILNLPRLEEVLLRVKSLHLSCLYPYWTSQAYHGLVELRLHRNYRKILIPEADLVAILSSSPDLKIFECGLQLENQLPPHALVTRVHLQSLEFLDLSHMSFFQCDSLIRWLAPGTGPLHVSLRVPFDARTFLFGEILLDFYARSVITHLSLDGRGPGTFLHLCDLLPLMPNLRNLDLSSFTLEPNADPPEYAPQLPHLDVLRATKCEIYTNELRRVAELHPIRELYICSGTIRTRTRLPEGDHWVPVKDNMTERDANLVGIVPFVKFTE